MTRRYLFGPVTPKFAEQYLYRDRQAKRCLAFNAAGTVDLTIGMNDSWETICTRLPEGWRPEMIVLFLPYTAIPHGLWTAPVPLVGSAGDWNLLWHCYRYQLPRCELVLTDSPGVEVLERQGLTHARAANLFGLGRAFLDYPWPDGPRDIDLLFVGNCNPAVQRERLSWLGRIAQLGRRWKVVIRSGVFGEEYRKLLSRARVVFNRSIRGEANMRVFEAAMAGALLFQEADNREVQNHFADRRECVFYHNDDLESLLEHYLIHEDERRAIAESARTRARRFGFADLWESILQDIVETEWAGIHDRMAGRRVLTAPESLLARTWQMQTSAELADTDLLDELRKATREGSAGSPIYSALALASTRLAQAKGNLTVPVAADAAEQFERAVNRAPEDGLAGLNLAEAHAVAGQRGAAMEQARSTLAWLEEQPERDAAPVEGAHFPVAFDLFGVEWDRAAWENAGRPDAEARAKRVLIRWRLHSMLAEFTGEVSHYYAAHMLRPDLPRTQAGLGCALARSGQLDVATGHLKRAVAGNPFDRAAARAYYQCLVDLGDQEAQLRFLEEQRCLARAAPQLVPLERWFEPTRVPPAADPIGPRPSVKRSDVRAVSMDEFHRRFGKPDTSRAVHSFTSPLDTHIVLTLLAQARPRRILEIGTARGDMTANLTEWSGEDACVFTLGIVADLSEPSTGPQKNEVPPRAEFGSAANHFGKVHKVLFITADSLHYDFRRIAPVDFVFIDGAHDLIHVLSDSRKAYEVLTPGGWLVWHDFGSTMPWVDVRQAVEQASFAEPVHHAAGTEVAFLQKQPVVNTVVNLAATAPAESRPTPAKNGKIEQDLRITERRPGDSSSSRGPSEPLRIVWEGSISEMKSLALVNRALCRKLIERGHDLSVISPVIPQGNPVPLLSEIPELAGRTDRPLAGPVDVHVRHDWPPSFSPPPCGRWVILQPWEFGSLPKSWVRPMIEEIDEVWVYTRFVRECYLQSGIPADRVHVIPLGVDPSVFRAEGPKGALQTAKRYKFLFVGGTISRKGIDLLLQAYQQAFTAQDDVCLVIKDMGVGSFYRGQTAEPRINRLREQPNAPEVEYINRPMEEEELAGLYRACDCLVHPYRGEGFGLPMAEAMACGLPVIVTGYGAALDFCNDDNAFLIPARIVKFPEKRVDQLATVDFPFWAEPDLASLKNRMRLVVDHPNEAQEKGRRACRHIHNHFTWDHAADAMIGRISELAQRPIRRLGRNAAITATPPSTRAWQGGRVSLCMIVKNEEGNLPDCLSRIADLVDEMIIVDTGSTDRTKELAAAAGARVFDFPWIDSFAAARNESLRHATGDWIFWLDADDRIDEANRARLKTLFAGLRDEQAAYVMKCVCLPDPVHGNMTVVDHVRLFRNHPAIRWEYRVHEQILPGVRGQGGEIRWSDVLIHHVGYQDPVLRGRKLQRDLRLLEMENTEKPADPFIKFNLGAIHHELGQASQALLFLRGSLERSHPTDSIVRKVYALMAHCHRQLGQLAEAQAVCQEGRRLYPEDAELLFHEGIVRRDRGDVEGAEGCLLRLVNGREAAHFASVDAGLRGYKARHNLAVIYQEQKRYGEAESQWKAALAEKDDFTPAWTGLGDLYLSQGRWAEFEQTTRQLQVVPRAGLEADVLRARGHLARKEFTQARQLVESAIVQEPGALTPRRVLTHVLLQEGRDWAAAEKALHELITLAPEDKEAHHNLAVLKRQIDSERPVSTPLG